MKYMLMNFLTEKQIIFLKNIKLFLSNKIFGKNKKTIKGNGNIIKIGHSRLYNVSFKITGSDNVITIGEESIIHNLNIVIHGSNHQLSIDYCRIEGGIFNFEDENCKIIIHDNTTIENGVHIASVEPNVCVTIGQDCMFSRNVDIRTTDSHSIIDIETNMRINPAKNIHIGNHVWLGVDVLVLKGVNIGDNCIVGARSVVTKNIPSNSLAVGIPSRVTRTKINWTRERIIS